MAAAERQRSADPADDARRKGRRPSPNRVSRPRHRVRLARGPLTIGEPAPEIDAKLATAEPYRPDSVADGGNAFGLTVRAASVRGLSKRYLGGPRQDDVCLRLHHPSGTVVAAVADGVSGAARSDLGAALAVRHATAAVLRQLDGEAEELDWDEVFAQAAWALVEEHRRVAGDSGAGPEEAASTLATTLLVAAISAPGATAGSAHTSGDIAAAVRMAAVGDSPAFVLAARSFRAIIGEPERNDGLLAHGVEALPRTTRALHADACRLQPGSVLLLCTDGLALPLAGGRGEVGRAFARELSRPPDVLDFARLLDFSRSTYDDDRTLVAIWLER